MRQDPRMLSLLILRDHLDLKTKVLFLIACLFAVPFR